ncbi:MATE efflux family protein 1 [Hibiscus syriacus]|uniref:non-specific serine/threonine protein kinase n=1 Tax=Hibiscus syriacus TaxID=106335 RepID=A0A6A2YMK1_HIBSY|nr:MATE efflux family protein 1 [Hibiscus syriacus]
MLEQQRFLYGSSLLLCISLGSFLFGVVISEIPLGSKLSVGGNDSWVSSNGDFAIGFFSRPDMPNRFSVGIRFDSKSIPVDEHSMVWVAGGDVAVSNSSYLELQMNGELVLFDALQGQEVWSAKTSQFSVVVAFLRDDGNLILLNEKKVVIWQSFDYPTNTLLPGQRLSPFRTLRAASQNGVSSLYSLYMNVSGQLQLRWESSIIYWSIGRPSQSNVNAILTSYGSLQLVAPTSGPLWSVYGEDHNDTVKFRFLRLDVDGNLRLYSWMDVSQTGGRFGKLLRISVMSLQLVTREASAHLMNPVPLFAHACFPIWSTRIQNAVSSQHGCKSGSILVEHADMFLYGIYPSMIPSPLFQPGSNVDHVSFTEIKDLTENFNHRIGPKMFKGALPDNQPVAIKELEATIEARKFRVALSKVGSIYHKGLVKLEGYCFLDENLEAKVNEFGLGMLYGEAASNMASAQKDVEDFGKMVLTLVSGLKEANDVFDWAYKEWFEGRPGNVVDKRLEDEVNPDELERVLRISFWCLQVDERLKPSMGEVVKVLEGSLPVDPPPPPFSCRRSRREEEDSSELGSVKT